MNEERVSEYVTQKAKTRHDRAECRELRQDIGKLDLQQVAWDRTFYKHRTGQRMHGPRLDRGKIGNLHAQFDRPSSALRVSSAISSPSPTSATGAISGW